MAKPNTTRPKAHSLAGYLIFWLAVTAALAVGVILGANVAGAATTSTFRDAGPEDSVHWEAIEWLAQEGISKGCNPPENTEFCPDRPITRGEMATFLQRFAELDGTDIVPPPAGVPISDPDREPALNEVDPDDPDSWPSGATPPVDTPAEPVGPDGAIEGTFEFRSTMPDSDGVYPPGGEYWLTCPSGHHPTDGGYAAAVELMVALRDDRGVKESSGLAGIRAVGKLDQPESTFTMWVVCTPDQ